VALLLWSVLVWLAELTVTRGARAGLALTAGLGAVALSGAAFPLGDFTLWRWCMSVHANPSVLFIGFLAAYVGSRLVGRPWLTVADRLTAYLIGFVVGGVLYGSATGYPRPDLYAWAWESGWVVVCAGALAAVLIVAGNRVGILLVVALAAHVADLMESHNLWDYLIDPFFWLLSTYGLVHCVFKRVFNRQQLSSGMPMPPGGGRPIPITTPAQTGRS
jgi:hypothetical protein